MQRGKNIEMHLSDRAKTEFAIHGHESNRDSSISANTEQVHRRLNSTIEQMETKG